MNFEREPKMSNSDSNKEAQVSGSVEVIERNGSKVSKTVEKVDWPTHPDSKVIDIVYLFGENLKEVKEIEFSQEGSSININDLLPSGWRIYESDKEGAHPTVLPTRKSIVIPRYSFDSHFSE